MSQKTLVIGKIASPYGVKGWVKVVSFTDPPENILKYQPWLIYKDKKIETLEVVADKMHSGRLIVQLKGINDPETARLFSNCSIQIEKEQLPSLPKNEYYWSDLEGLEVVNTQNVKLGVVDHVMATGSNDVLVILGEKRHLIPYLPDDVILNIDLVKKTILVDWDPDF